MLKKIRLTYAELYELNQPLVFGSSCIGVVAEFSISFGGSGGSWSWLISDLNIDCGTFSLILFSLFGTLWCFSSLFLVSLIHPFDCAFSSLLLLYSIKLLFSCLMISGGIHAAAPFEWDWLPPQGLCAAGEWEGEGLEKPEIELVTENTKKII